MIFIIMYLFHIYCFIFFNLYFLNFFYKISCTFTEFLSYKCGKSASRVFLMFKKSYNLDHSHPDYNYLFISKTCYEVVNFLIS